MLHDMIEFISNLMGRIDGELDSPWGVLIFGEIVFLLILYAVFFVFSVHNGFLWGIGLFLFFLIADVALMWNGREDIEQGKVALVESFGKYSRMLQPGLHFLFPVLENLSTVKIGVEEIKYIDRRERMLDTEEQYIYTQEQLEIGVDAVLYWRVIDPRKVAYEVTDIKNMLQELAYSSIRSAVASMPMEDVIRDREKVAEAINTEIQDNLGEIKRRAVTEFAEPIKLGETDAEEDAWGIKITRVLIQNIKIKEALEKAVEREEIAEREGKAKKTEAEYELEASRLLAQARAVSITEEFKAIQEARPDSRLIALKALDALQRLSEGEGSTVFMPVQFTEILQSIAEGLKRPGEPVSYQSYQNPPYQINNNTSGNQPNDDEDLLDDFLP